LRIRAGLKGLRSNFILIAIGLFIGIWVFVSTNPSGDSFFQDFWFRSILALSCAGFPVAWRGMSKNETARPGTVTVAGSDAWMIGGIAKIVFALLSGGILFPITVYTTISGYRALKAKEATTLSMPH
jgi:hypothetical protein